MAIALLPASPSGEISHLTVREKINEIIPALEKESAIFDRGYAAGTVNGAAPPFEIALTSQYNDSADITKVDNFKITLKAGSKYKLQGFMNCTCDPSGYMDYRFFDATNTAFIGIQGTIILDTNGGNSGSVVQPVAYVDVVSDVDIELQWTGGATVNAYYAAVVIQKI